MGRVEVNRQSHISFIEECWWEGTLDGQVKVDVHCKVLRSDGEGRSARYSAQAHVHRPGGGLGVRSEGWSSPAKRTWFDSRDDAVNDALRHLEARDDVRLQ